MINLSRRNLKHNITLILCSLFLCILSASCEDRGVFYSHFYEFKEGEWLQKDTLVFEIDSTCFAINTPYSLSLEITNTPKYPYKNIWLFAQHNISNDSIFQNISREFQLADEMGKWNGSGFGTLFQSSFIIEESIIFKEKRNYTIKIGHGMKDEPLIGIEKFGVKLSKKNNS